MIAKTTKSLKDAILALFTTEAQKQEEFRTLSMLRLTEAVEREFGVNTPRNITPRNITPRNIGAASPGAHRALGPVACADCWQIVDDAPIGSLVLCNSCREAVLDRR